MQQQFDPRNADIQIWVGDRLFPREDAKVSVFDSSVQGGDAVWEGLRMYNGRIFSFEDHLNRLFESAHAMNFANVPSAAFVREAIRATLHANGMRDGAHIRLTLTRGKKITSGMDPRLNQFGCTLIVLAEWKPPVYPDSGISLSTSSIRRNGPSTLDSKIHHNNLINNILAKIEANMAGADDALMLDMYGFVAETNATNVFMVKNGVVLTPNADACLPGITRKKIIILSQELGIPCVERNISMTEIFNADEVFTTGTMGELTPVHSVDGRKIQNKSGLSILKTLQEAYKIRTSSEGEVFFA